MNYYSRNSPVKKKRNPPPGFLIPFALSSSARSTSRPKLKSQFNLSSHPSPPHSEAEYNNSQQMLILDDDRIYVPDSGEILIQEDQEDPINRSSIQNNQKLQKSSKQQQEQQKFTQINLKEYPKNSSNNFTTIQTVKKQSEDFSFNSQIHTTMTQQDDKNILRNYSFGSKQFHQSNINEKLEKSFSNQPLIRKIVNIQFPSNQIVSQKQIKKTQKDKLVNQPITTTVQPQQNWNKLVKNFIKKRQSSKQEPKQKQLSDDSKQIKQIERVNSIDQEEVESNETGYFGIAHQQKYRNQQLFGRGQQRQTRKGSHKFEQISYAKRQATKTRKQSQQIHIQQQDQSQSPRKFEDKWIGQLNQKSQQSQSVTFSNSTSLLQSTIKQLPQKLVPTYLAIHQQLVRRQHEAEITLKRMHETQEMIKMLIKLQQESIFVDDLLLADFHSPSQERIASNQEIIFSLVRKLASFM